MEYSVISVLIACLVCFCCTTNQTWSSPEISMLNSSDEFEHINNGPFKGTLTSDQGSWLGSLLALGACFGPFLFGFLADAVGRKYSILGLTVPFSICNLAMAFASNIYIFYVARFLIGLAVGGTYTVVPMYIGEMSPESYRGVLGNTMNVFICGGLLFTYIVGPLINRLIFNLIIGLIPVCFAALFVFAGVETPQYYISKNRLEDARKSLQRMRQETEEDVEKELQMIKHNIESEDKAGIAEIFKSPGLRKAIIITMGLVAFQQFTGINAILFYAQDIFKAAGSEVAPAINSMIIGAVQFGSSFITPIVSVRFGRVPLLIASGLGMLITEGALGIYEIIQEHHADLLTGQSSIIKQIPIISLVLYIIVYNIGFGPIPWAVSGELFPNNVKSSASAMTASFCWFVGFFVTKYFQQISDAVGMGECFVGFAVACVVAAAFSKFFVIETKDKTLKEIQEALSR